MIAKGAKATRSQLKTRWGLGTNAARNVRIRQMATTQGTTNVQIMRATKSVFTGDPFQQLELPFETVSLESQRTGAISSWSPT